MLDRGGLALGWTIAANLTSGDLIADIDGGKAVKVVSNSLTQTQETVYNFEVEEAHSYFADDLGLWVHNPSGRIRIIPTEGGNLRTTSSLTPPIVGGFMVLPQGLKPIGCIVGAPQPRLRDKGKHIIDDIADLLGIFFG